MELKGSPPENYIYGAIPDKLKDKTIPMHMLYSSNDRLLDLEALDKLHNQKHNIKLIIRDGTSHNIPLEFPELFASSIKKWIKE